MNILTIIVLAIIIVFGMIGHAKGFVKMLLSVMSLVATLFLASIISPGISAKLQESELFDSVYDKTYEYVNEIIIETAADSIEDALDELQLPGALKDYIVAGERVNSAGEGIARLIATKLTSLIFDILVFMVTFIAAMVAVKLIFAALNIMTHLPIIHGANQIIGLFVGMAEGLIIVWIFFIVISLMGNSEFAVDMYKQINESEILTFLYNNNVILNFIFKK